MLSVELGSDLNRPYHSLSGELANGNQEMSFAGRMYRTCRSTSQADRARRNLIEAASIKAARRRKLESDR